MSHRNHFLVQGWREYKGKERLEIVIFFFKSKMQNWKVISQRERGKMRGFSLKEREKEHDKACVMAIVLSGIQKETEIK